MGFRAQGLGFPAGVQNLHRTPYPDFVMFLALTLPRGCGRCGKHMQAPESPVITRYILLEAYLGQSPYSKSMCIRS